MTENMRTGGGAGVGGGVGTGGGDFSGRDRYTTFNTPSEGIQNLLYLSVRLENKIDLLVMQFDQQEGRHDLLAQRVNDLSNRATIALTLGVSGAIALAMQLWMK